MTPTKSAKRDRASVAFGRKGPRGAALASWRLAVQEEEKHTQQHETRPLFLCVFLFFLYRETPRQHPEGRGPPLRTGHWPLATSPRVCNPHSFPIPRRPTARGGLRGALSLLVFACPCSSLLVLACPHTTSHSHCPPCHRTTAPRLSCPPPPPSAVRPSHATACRSLLRASASWGTPAAARFQHGRQVSR